MDIGSASLSKSAIETVPYRDTFATYIEEYGGNVELLLSPVDSEEGRRALARTLPKRVINAATGGTTVTLSSHGFGDGKACLHCLYPTQLNRPSRAEIMADDLGIALGAIQDLLQTNRPMGADLVAQIERNHGVEPGIWAHYVKLPVDSFYVRAICGDASVRLPFANVIAPPSFISASAGILLAAELVKAGNLELSDWRLDNYFRVDTLHLPQPEFRRLRRQDTTGQCICRDPDYLEAYEQKYSTFSSTS